MLSAQTLSYMLFFCYRLYIALAWSTGTVTFEDADIKISADKD